MKTTTLEQNYKLCIIIAELIQSFQDLRKTDFSTDELDILIRNYDLKIQVLMKKGGV